MSLLRSALFLYVFLATYAAAASLVTLAPSVITKCTVPNAVALTFVSNFHIRNILPLTT